MDHLCEQNQDNDTPIMFLTAEDLPKYGIGFYMIVEEYEVKIGFCPFCGMKLGLV